LLHQPAWLEQPLLVSSAHQKEPEQSGSFFDSRNRRRGRPGNPTAQAAPRERRRPLASPAFCAAGPVRHDSSCLLLLPGFTWYVRGGRPRHLYPPPMPQLLPGFTQE
jgi:hypothetical protein